MAAPLIPPDPIPSPDGFTNAIHNSIDQAVLAIPPGKTHALVIDGTYDQTDGPTFQATWLTKVNEDFEIVASGEYSGNKGVAGKVEGIIAW